ncbi:MAG: tetratricopeptide repeat protein [Ignavibacteria bacterium]|nr:tetratricopeptide repeat protein [Ignavibacteria bacterium]
MIAFAVLFGGWALYDDLSRDIPALQDQDHEHAPPASATQGNQELLAEVQQLQRMVEAHPEDDDMLLRLANVLQDYSREDHQSLHLAAETYERYLQRNPDNENARVDLGICYFDLARHDSADARSLLQRAIREMKSVAEKNPRHQAAAFNLGIVMLNAGDAQESGDWFRRAAAIDPGSSLGQRATRLLEEHTFSE